MKVLLSFVFLLLFLLHCDIGIKSGDCDIYQEEATKCRNKCVVALAYCSDQSVSSTEQADCLTKWLFADSLCQSSVPSNCQ